MMKTRTVSIAAACLLILGLVGCVKERPADETVAVREEQKEHQEPDQPSPRVLASLKLTDQGRRYVVAGDADRAIRVLEQAISLNSNNGQNYYYLSEAWLLKGFAAEARQFNGLAESHLTGDKDWEKLVTRQAERIIKLEEKIKKSR